MVKKRSPLPLNPLSLPNFPLNLPLTTTPPDPQPVVTSGTSLLLQANKVNIIPVDALYHSFSRLRAQVAPQALERRGVEQGSEERRAENRTARHEKVARKSEGTLIVNPKRFETAG